MIVVVATTVAGWRSGPDPVAMGLMDTKTVVLGTSGVARDDGPRAGTEVWTSIAHLVLLETEVGVAQIPDELVPTKLDGTTILTSVETVPWLERVTKRVFVILAVTVMILIIVLGHMVEVELSEVHVCVPSAALELQLEVSWSATKTVLVVTEGHVLVTALTLPLFPPQEWPFPCP